VPNGYPLDGKNHTIFAVDPGPALDGTPGAFTGAVVANGGTSMNVTNLTIQGASTAVDNCRDFNGVALLGASGSISNVALDGIGFPASGCQNGRAILVDAIGSPIQQSVKIENNVVSNYNKNGIDVRGNVAAKIDGNTVTSSASSAIIRNGIVVRTGASAQVWSNTVSGNLYDGSSATGLLVLAGATVNLTKPNTLIGNDLPSYIDGSTIVGKNKVNP
jgi:hypothetical protein